MLGSLFRPSAKSSTPAPPPKPDSSALEVGFDAEGILYAADGARTAQWLAMPFAYADAADPGARLAQLHAEGFGEAREHDFLLRWSDVYAVLHHPDLEGYGEALRIPPPATARPRLASQGALLDADFSIQLSEWVDPQGQPIQPTPKFIGAVLQIGQRAFLLPEPVHALLQELWRFHATPAADRTREFKELAFGRMRRLAVDTGSPVSDYVARTIVLTPERLRLSMRRSGNGESAIVEVVPGFDEAPARWLDLFDRLPLQDIYDVPDGPALVRVVPAPSVRSVLAEIKRMPGRRASGARAEAFVRNPLALLGPDSRDVIDPDRFEAARDEAGIRFERFTPHAEHGESGALIRVGLLIEALSADEAQAVIEWFESPPALAEFIEKLQRRFDEGRQCCLWQGHEIEIVGETADHLAQLDTWLRQWSHPQLWTAAEVFDLGNYSQRIESIGVEKPFLVPIIVRNDAGSGWFESNVSVGIRVEDASGGEPKMVPLNFDEIPSLAQAVEAAEVAGRLDVSLPGLRQPVPIADARAAVDALMRARGEIKQHGFHPPSGRTVAAAKKRLVLKRNLEDIDYTEDRAESLGMPENRQPVLPQSLRPEIELKPHQHIGIAWLQHLWEQSPERCRGTVLADDMGLGKTLQLLAFIASCFEADPDLPPALVVAPVALLENWRNELSKFFRPDALPLLTLYGDALRSLRASKHEMDDALKAQGVTRLLKKNWVGGAKLVLTTYETMRDLEFALAGQSWSIMVCDEAQKIKTPAALVTRSAKKQKVRFRIACTGTPVENTLADLWCLFDFVQPGMLGALSHFSRTYRQPIEARTDEQKAKVEELRTVIQPQILHRRKVDVAKDLPAPVEDDACKKLPMSAFQLGLYENALAVLRTQRETNPSAQLQALMAIRQICSDPHGHAESSTRVIEIARLVNESPKMGWLIDLLKALAADGAAAHKVIVFCEFRELQLLLQRVVAAFFGFAPHVINGNTSADPKAEVNRQKLIDDFQHRPGFGVIILSPLAAGFGVNIQAANHVVHFTRTWNPAKEDQATARAYRIGQRRAVTIYYPGVVSDKIPSFDVTLDRLLSRKRALASDMLNGCSDLKVADFADFGLV